MDRDFSRSRAILIGNAVYRPDSGITDIPAAATCVAAMSELLTGELCGWPPERITRLVDVHTPQELAREIRRAVADVRDTLLLYYVGHGLRTPLGKLALTVADTDADPGLIHISGILYENVAEILRCGASTKLVILDCCKAELGNKANYALQGVDIAEEYPVEGLYFIGASKQHESARFALDGTLTYFTQTFIDVVRKGIPGQPAQLRLDQIFRELRRRLVAANLPEPVESGIRGARLYPFADNSAAPESHIDYEVENQRLREQLAARSAVAASGPTSGPGVLGRVRTLGNRPTRAAAPTVIEPEPAMPPAPASPPRSAPQVAPPAEDSPDRATRAGATLLGRLRSPLTAAVVAGVLTAYLSLVFLSASAIGPDKSLVAGVQLLVFSAYRVTEVFRRRQTRRISLAVVAVGALAVGIVTIALMNHHGVQPRLIGGFWMAAGIIDTVAAVRGGSPTGHGRVRRLGILLSVLAMAVGLFLLSDYYSSSSPDRVNVLLPAQFVVAGIWLAVLGVMTVVIAVVRRRDPTDA